MGKKASILVVSGNLSSKNAVKCLKSLKANTPTDLVREIIIIEAGIRPDFNHAEEINRVMGIFKGDYLVLLDDDVELHTGWLNGLIECAGKYKDAGIVGAVLLDKKGKIIHTGGDVTDTYFGLELKEPISKPVERRYVCSAVMLITRAAAEKIGPFEEGFKKYFQDADYCFRAWEAGFKVVVSPDSKAVHLIGQTAVLLPNLKELVEKDKNKFYSKWRQSSFYNRFDVIDLTRRGVSCPFIACDVKYGFSGDITDGHLEQRSLEEMKREMDELRHRFRMNSIDISGGEPTDYKHLCELVAYCRSIGLLPAIVTNGQKSGAYAGLIDAGLDDVLIRIEGRREDRDRDSGIEGAFDHISRTIGIFKTKNFGFRTRTTLTGFNYKNLPELAGNLVAMGPRMADFVSFNPLEGTGREKGSVVNPPPRYSDLAPRLAEAVSRLMVSGIWANVRHVPLCMLKGYEQHVCNFHQSPWDPYEWEFFQWFKINKSEMTKIRRKTRREKLYGVFPEVQRKLWMVKHRICWKNVFFDQCARCANRAICDGVDPLYAAKFGSGEFVACEGESIRDPLYYRKKNQAWRIMKQRPVVD